MKIDDRPRRGRKVIVSARPRRARFLEVDALEDRRVPAVYMVNSPADFLTPPPGTPAGTLTLRQAIQMANASAGTGVNNTIQLTVAGTYQITSVGNGATDNTSGEFAIDGANGYNLTITNTSGGRVVIDGGGLNRVFDINPAAVPEATSVTFQDVTITDGTASGDGGGIRAQNGASVVLRDVDLTHNYASGDGGGVFVGPGSLTINNSSIVDNFADSGGGVFSEDGTSITGSFFQGNVASAAGGGLSIGVADQSTTSLRSSVTSASVTGTRFSGNVASDGGAINDLADKLTLQYCTLDQDHAFGTATIMSGGDGGGLYVPGPGASAFDPSVTVANCLFLNNAANYANMGAGGAILQESGTLTVQNSQLVGNRADDLGGGINFSGTTLTIRGTTIDNSRSNGEGGALYFAGTGTGAAGSTLTNDTLTLNSAYDGGGGIFDTASGDLTLLYDTINANSGGGFGGGIEYVSGKLAIGNTIIAQNTVGHGGVGPDVFAGGILQVTDVGGNLVGNDSGSAGFSPGALIGTPANPVNPKLGPLLDNGAVAPYTPSTVGGGTVMYYAGAPASLQVVQTEALLTTSPAFNAGVAAAAPTTDERGFSRPAANPSIGAYEPQYSSTATPSQVYVEDLYEILFNRPADAGGLSYWASKVNSTGTNGAAVVLGIESFPEYRMDQIKLFYERYLGRPADGGLSFWLGFLNSGGTFAQVQAGFLGSAEYARDHDGNNVSVVESLYENVLNRIPRTDEVDNWARLLKGGYSPTSMATGFVSSQEYLTDLITADYPAFLGRAPHSSDVTAWLGLESGSPDPESALTWGILGSPEAYHDRTIGSP